ncbi:uncharacterized protein I303_103923 [Kwoniella dejecticola CBS 10117]|uniref:F-box domain-containing protein n=1 Tax=Kwoniella dejecticola CBS 10117 TaxID=1296121 RepID=A0A1A6A840_9TREE|nr:uncharacterized protein I303_03940 [Kwoniella dejecticola CBS 10117]OBR86220.1 hypothetical protein I303_03940 [Kwoniella dejecticola CBS 10117]
MKTPEYSDHQPDSTSDSNSTSDQPRRCQSEICVRSDGQCHCRICQRQQQPVPQQVAVIPAEVWSMVWAYLTPSELNKVVKTCKYFHNSASQALYEVVSIGNPTHLLAGILHETTNNRFSKRTLLMSTKKLYFLYDEIKTDGNDPRLARLGDASLNYCEGLTGLQKKVTQFEQSTQQLREVLRNSSLQNFSRGHRPNLTALGWICSMLVQEIDDRELDISACDEDGLCTIQKTCLKIYSTLDFTSLDVFKHFSSSYRGGLTIRKFTIEVIEKESTSTVWLVCPLLKEAEIEVELLKLEEAQTCPACGM